MHGYWFGLRLRRMINGLGLGLGLGLWSWLRRKVLV